MTGIYERRIPPVDPRQEVGARALEAKAVNSSAEIDFSEINPPGLDQLLRSHVEMMEKALGTKNIFLHNHKWEGQSFDNQILCDRAEIYFNGDESRITILPDSENFKPMQWALCQKEESMKPEEVSSWQEISGGAFTNLVISTRRDGLTFIETNDAGNKICSHISPDGQVKITA